MRKITLAIVDDHVLYRQGLTMMIDQEPTFELLFEAENGRTFINQLDTYRPEIAILDLDMPIMNGVEVMKYFKPRKWAPQVIVLSFREDHQTILKMIRLGVKAYLPKSTTAEDIREAVFAVRRNGFHFTPLVSQAMLFREKHLAPSPWTPPALLTARESEILGLMCREWTSLEIAQKLEISARTVEHHRKKIMIKVGARNMAGVIIYAVRQGMVE